MKKIISLTIAFILLFGMVAPVEAVIYNLQPFIKAMNELKVNGKMSNDILHYVNIDLNTIETAGTVTAVVYESVYEQQTINNFTNIMFQTPNTCYDKLTRFIFELTNQYRPQNTELALQIFWDEQTVGAWTYGQYKDQAMYAIVSGIPDCLNNEPYYPPPSGGGSSSSGSSDSSWIDPYSPENIGTDPIESFQVTTFTIDNKTYAVTTTDTNETESIAPTVQTMDVSPYIKDNRTYVPVRYLSYSLGVEENNVSWDANSRKVDITKDETNIALIIGSPVMLVNQKPVRMDVSPEITNDRTFLPARWVAEALGAEVKWDDTTKQTTIKIPTIKPGN